jgi:hypothetical protein
LAGWKARKLVGKLETLAVELTDILMVALMEEKMVEMLG